MIENIKGRPLWHRDAIRYMSELQNDQPVFKATVIVDRLTKIYMFSFVVIGATAILILDAL